MNQVNPESLCLTERGTAWLEGFAHEDREAARDMIRGLTIVTFSDFRHEIEQLIDSHSQRVTGPIALFNVRETAHVRSDTADPNFIDSDLVSSCHLIGSEGHLASIITGIVRSDKRKFLSQPDIPTMRQRRCRIIVLVDDLIGSGKRTSEYIQMLMKKPSLRSWVSLGYTRIQVIAFASLARGSDRVERLNCRPRVCSVIECPTFMRLPWKQERRNAVSFLAQTYAPRTSWSRYPLGFDGCMTSLVFEHGCPNNAPPILWAEGCKHHAWHPLFPNRAFTQQVPSVFPPEIARGDPRSALIEVGQQRLAHTINQPSLRADKRTLVLLGLIAKGQRKNAALTFATGLSNKSLERILERCMRCDWITTSRRITSSGVSELRHARKIGRTSNEIPSRGTDYYHPQVLREAKL